MPAPSQQQQQLQPPRTKPTTLTVSRRAADDCCFLPPPRASSRPRDRARSRPSASPRMGATTATTTQTGLLGQTRWRTFTAPSTTSSYAWRSGTSATRRCLLRTWNSSVRCVPFFSSYTTRYVRVCARCPFSL